MSLDAEFSGVFGIGSQVFSDEAMRELENSVTQSYERSRQLIALLQASHKDFNGEKHLNKIHCYRQRLLDYIAVWRKGGGTDGTGFPRALYLYDELLVLYILLFSNIEEMYRDVLHKTFEDFLSERRLVLKRYAPVVSGEGLPGMNLERIIGKRTTFDFYTFTLVLRILLMADEKVKKICSKVFEEDVSTSTEKFTHSLIYLAGTRNQIAHMSTDFEYYSLSNPGESFERLSIFFITAQLDFKKVLDLFGEFLKSEPI
jgi:hypothetical protein